jgi:hypothetical protein
MISSKTFVRPLLAVLPLLLLSCDPQPREAVSGPVAAPAASPTPPETPATAPAAGPSDPFGYYFLNADKPQPDWAQTIDHLHLSTFDMKGDEMVTVPLYGFIRPKQGDDYPLIGPKIEGDHFSFTTQEINGIAFAFDGRFLASGNFPETPPEGVVLTGKLRQLQKGQPAGEMDAEFTYSPGD